MQPRQQGAKKCSKGSKGSKLSSRAASARPGARGSRQCARSHNRPIENMGQGQERDVHVLRAQELLALRQIVQKGLHGCNDGQHHAVLDEHALRYHNHSSGAAGRRGRAGRTAVGSQQVGSRECRRVPLACQRCVLAAGRTDRHRRMTGGHRVHPQMPPCLRWWTAGCGA